MTNVVNIDSKKTLDRIGDEIIEYIKPTVQAQFQQLYPLATMDTLVPIVEKFADLVGNPIRGGEIEVTEENTTPKFQEFSNELELFHNSLKLSEVQKDQCLVLLNDFYGLMQDQSADYCNRKAAENLQELMGMSTDPGSELLGISFGFKDPDTDEWFERDIDLSKKKGNH